MAAATWLDDDSANLSEEQQAATDELEQQVYGLLQQVASYMRQLEQGPGSGAVAAPAAAPAGLQGSSSSNTQRPLLPDSVLLFAPPPPSRQRSVADYLIKAGGHTGCKVCGVQVQCSTRLKSVCNLSACPLFRTAGMEQLKSQVLQRVAWGVRGQ
jgi:hypothetical protein